jgi:hypothetical protein
MNNIRATAQNKLLEAGIPVDTILANLQEHTVEGYHFVTWFENENTAQWACILKESSLYVGYCDFGYDGRQYTAGHYLSGATGYDRNIREQVYRYQRGHPFGESHRDAFHRFSDHEAPVDPDLQDEIYRAISRTPERECYP